MNSVFVQVVSARQLHVVPFACDAQQLDLALNYRIPHQVLAGPRRLVEAFSVEHGDASDRPEVGDPGLDADRCLIGMGEWTGQRLKAREKRRRVPTRPAEEKVTFLAKSQPVHVTIAVCRFCRTGVRRRLEREPIRNRRF